MIKLFMKKLLKHFILLLIVGISTTLGYGFLIGGELSIYYYIFESITLIATSLLFARKNINKKFVAQISEITAMIILVIAISLFSYNVVNDFSGELVAEYDTKISVHYGGRHHIAYFTDSQGNEGSIYYNRELFYANNYDLYPYEGDTIHVREYKGLFGLPYYESDSWENTNPNDY